MATKKITKNNEYVFKKKWIKDNIKSIDASNDILKFIDKYIPAKQIPTLFTKEPWSKNWYLDNVNVSGDAFVNNCGIIEMLAENVTLANLMLARLDNYRIAVCSLNNRQSKMLPAIKKLGFKVVHPWGKNPNSGNDICMLSIDLGKKFKL